jgi:hypothetical protein
MSEHESYGAHPFEPTPIGDAVTAALAVNGGQDDASTAIVPTYVYKPAETPMTRIIGNLLEPFTINLDEWARALFDAGEFAEADPDEMSLAMLAQILSAQSSDEALSSLEMDRAKKLAGDEPGGHSPLLQIRSARPMKSSFDEGARCYVIVDAIRKVDGASVRFTTGAKTVQAVILTHMANGWMPFDAVLTIRRTATRRGFYPLGLEAGG